ncbi:MAG: S8 family serine peptidase [Candidatus Eremiobacteraeota bacterium]|nr:S8 family serine peptidase [Candidatus Eremiobacteraeota bacterium]
MICAAAALVAGCGGGGGSSSTPSGPPATATPTASPTPSPTPLPGSSSTSITVSPSGSSTGTFGPVSGGFSATATIPAASVAASLNATFLPGGSQPTGTPTIQNLRRRPQNIGAQNIQAIAFVTITTNVTVTFPRTPDFTFTAPYNVSQLGGFAYVAEYDPTKPSGTGWTTIEGPATASGNTLSFTGGPPPITLQAGQTYAFLLFSVPQAIPTPTPTPTASPTPTVSPTPTASPTPTVTPTATPTPNSSTKTFMVSSAGPSTVTFDTIPGGITASLTMPATTSGSATFTATLTAAPPNGVPVVSDVRRRPRTVGGTLTPIAYVTITSTASVTFPSTPGASVTVPSAASPYGYLGYFDPANTSQSNNWEAIGGAATFVGGKFTFSNSDANYTIASGTTATFAFFSSNALVAVTPPGNTDSRNCASYAVGANGKRRAPRTDALLSSIVPNQLYVTRHSDARTASGVRNAASTARVLALGTENGLVHEAITLAAGVDATKAAAALRATSGVVDVASVHRRFLASDGAANDPLLSTTNQWYLYITNVDPGAWSVTHGTGIKAAVIDTGVDETNQDLAAKLDKTESIVDGVITTSAQDTNGHGTNVSGLVAAQPNNGYGFAGTGWDVHLLVYKIFPDATSTSDCQSASTADEAAAIRDAVANGAAVINLSLGSPQSSGADTAEQQAVAYAQQNGVIVVAADGNEGPGQPPDYPAAYANVVAVGASAVMDSTANSYTSITSETVASYSNDTPTLVAPGGDASSGSDGDILHWILGYGTTTAGLPGDRCTNSGGVCEVLFNGTSQATPQVTGAVSLLLAKHGGRGSLSASQVITDLRTSAHSIGVSSTRQGAGRLDVNALLALP